MQKIYRMRNVLMMFALMMGVALQPAAAQDDAKAKEMLDHAYAMLAKLKSLKADFTLELKGGGVNDTKKGTFYMKGPKYRVEIAGQEIICNNETLWTIIKATNEVQITEYNPDAQAISPAKLFTDNFFENEYYYKYAGKRKVSGKTCDVIQLTPKSKDKQFSKVEIAITEKKVILGGQVWEKNGNTYRYDIAKYDANPPSITDATFVFDPKAHPDMEVIDLR